MIVFTDKLSQKLLKQLMAVEDSFITVIAITILFLDPVLSHKRAERCIYLSAGITIC